MCRKTVQRVVQTKRKKSEKMILEFDRKVEDYIRHLNKNEQYGVVLYSNADLIVPGEET